MKRVFSILAAVVVVAFMTTSCDKTCKCKTYVLGDVVSETEVTLDKDNQNIKKCSDMNTIVTVNDLKNGVECK